MKLYVGENLKRLRSEKNVTQDAVAEYLGVTYQAVSRWENGLAYPDIEFLPELARFFEVSLEELLGTESNEDRIRDIVSECYELNENNNKPAALSKLRSLEREYPNNWYIKQAICRVLVYPTPESFDPVLPELRRYASEGLKSCTVKDAWQFRQIVSSLVKAVPEEEVGDWIKYIPAAHNPNANTVLKERYRIRNDREKALHYGSEAIMANLIYLEMSFVTACQLPEDVIVSRKYANDVIDAVIGKPYRKDGRVHNSIMIWERSVYQTQIAGGYAGVGETERAIEELTKAVDMWIMQADALKEDCFTSDSPFIEARKNRWGDKFQGVDFAVDAMTNVSDWAWFDSIREDPRFKAQLERILTKKEELIEYFKKNDPHKYD